MKKLYTNTFTKSILTATSISFILFVVFSLGSCAKKLTFQSSPVVPAATGKVKIKKTKNDNYTIDIDIKNLAPAKRLSPAREVYVVWMESGDRLAEKLGMIKTSSGFLSDALKGSMSATSTVKPTRIFITAEDNGTVTYPGQQVVLETKN